MSKNTNILIINHLKNSLLSINKLRFNLQKKLLKEFEIRNNVRIFM